MLTGPSLVLQYAGWEHFCHSGNQENGAVVYALLVLTRKNGRNRPLHLQIYHMLHTAVFKIS